MASLLFQLGNNNKIKNVPDSEIIGRYEISFPDATKALPRNLPSPVAFNRLDLYRSRTQF